MHEGSRTPHAPTSKIHSERFLNVSRCLWFLHVKSTRRFTIIASGSTVSSLKIVLYSGLPNKNWILQATWIKKWRDRMCMWSKIPLLPLYWCIDYRGRITINVDSQWLKATDWIFPQYIHSEFNGSCRHVGRKILPNDQVSCSFLTFLHPLFFHLMPFK